jgi:hypothetical protein
MILAIPVFLMISGCASKKNVIQDPEHGLILKYHMPEKQMYKYLFSSTFDQRLDIRGQSISINGNETRRLSIQSEGRKNNKINLAATIDSMTMEMTSPQGEIVPDMSDVIGKNFSFSLSELGKEGDLPEGTMLEYELVPGEKASALSGLQAMFPDLPRRRVKLGDTWISSDTITEKTSRGEVHLYLQSSNRLEAIDTVNGMRCARVVAEVTGTLESEGKEQGTTLLTNAAVTGTDIWYFAFDTGVFVKSISTGVAEGSIKAMGPQEMTIPLKREYQIEIALTD